MDRDFVSVGLTMRIEEIDRNFKIEPVAEENGVVYYDVTRPPFTVYGLMRDADGFCRMPQEAAKQVSEGVSSLNRNTAGGRVRFRTDSSFVAVRVTMPWGGKMSHMAFCGSAGFDLYYGSGADIRFQRAFLPPLDLSTGFSCRVDLDGSGMRETTLHFPLYSSVSKLQLGLAPGAAIAPTEGYGKPGRIVYYGSSITQGACASRPGMAYQNILSRRLDIDHLNLGFSGGAKGEDAMIAYLASLPMTAFVLDYDHNAPDPGHLARTHEPLFLAVRKTHPDLPIVMASRPKAYLNEEEKARREIVRATYEHAIAAGDKAVRMVDGSRLMLDFCKDEGTVDGTHPNDVGFFAMAKAIGDALQSLGV